MNPLFYPRGLVTSGLVAHYPFGASDGDRKRNLLRWSEDFREWSKTGLTTPTAKRALETAVSSEHYLNSAIEVSGAQTYTMVLRLKPDGRTKGNFHIVSTARFGVDFDLATEAVVAYVTGTGAVSSVVCVDDGDGYKKITVTGSLNNAVTTGQFVIMCKDDAGNTTYLGDITKGFIVDYAQLNEGTVPLQKETTTANQILFDRSPFANHGQLGSTATADVNDGSWTNQGLTLITDDYITLPQDVSSRLGGASGATVEMVFKRNAAGVSHSFLGLSINGTDSKVAVNFNADDTITVGGRSRAADAFQSKTTSAAYADTASYHYLASWVDVANNAIGIDYDGIEVALAAGAVAFGQTTFAADVGTRQVLGANAGLANFVNASISHGMVRGRVLSAAERARNRSVLRGIMARRGIALA